jgi:prepilin-type N-terminal cleavage/methylation domain-containing protein
MIAWAGRKKQGGMLRNQRNFEALKLTETTKDGFTLIELLIVIVVLGILAAVVIFALGGITGKTAVASCQADGATVATAMAAFKTENPGTTVTTANITADTLGGPYIQSWPSNLPHYAYTITGGNLTISTGPADGVTGGGLYVTYTGPNTCAAVQ